MNLPDGLDFLMRPVSEGYITYDKLLDGTIGMWDLALMNDAIDAKAENQRRAAEQERGRHG